MNIGALLQSGIYLVSSALLYPAMAALLISFLVTVAACGGFIAEWAGRHRAAKSKSPESWLSGETEAAADELRNLLAVPGASWGDVEAFWREIKRTRWKKLDYLRIFVRLGPSMGLVGTLIPMSTGLASMSQGDMSRLSSDLVIAFSTTIVGLAVGVGAYILHTLRSRWIEADLDRLQTAIERTADSLLGAAEGSGER